MHALPLLRALDISIPFDKAVKTIRGGEFPKFNLKNVVKIEARFVEDSGNALGDLDTLIKNWPWVMDYLNGGGILYDMAVHPLNVLAILGFETKEILEVKLGRPSGITKAIPVTIEAGKNALQSDGQIVLTDKFGLTLHWDMFPLDAKEQVITSSKLILKRKGFKDYLAAACMELDCYALIMEELRQIAKNRSPDKPVTYYLKEHVEIIQLISKLHELVRSEELNTKVSVIKQLALHGTFAHNSKPNKSEKRELQL